jgi:hypothetical protein
MNLQKSLWQVLREIIKALGKTHYSVPSHTMLKYPNGKPDHG